MSSGTNVIAISSVAGALRWGDGWESAYYRLRRVAEQQQEEAAHALMLMETDLAIERAQRLLERIALEDEIKRLKGASND